MAEIAGKAVRSVRDFVVMVVLVTALAALNFFLSACSSEPAVYYGPQPAPDTGDVEKDDFVVYYGCRDACFPPDLLDVVEPEDAPPVDGLEDVPAQPDEIEPQVHYGPVPVDVLEDVPAQPDEIEPQVHYGPVPVDVADATPLDTEPELIPSWYGPMPNDVAADTDHEDVAPDIKPDCPPIGIYGPQPCDSDEMCQEQMGENWYCDEDNTFDDGCGGKIEWPMCKEKE